MKAVKNEVEIQNMRKSSIRDSAALVQFFYWLEQEVDWIPFWVLFSQNIEKKTQKNDHFWKKCIIFFQRNTCCSQFTSKMVFSDQSGQNVQRIRVSWENRRIARENGEIRWFEVGISRVFT